MPLLPRFTFQMKGETRKRQPWQVTEESILTLPEIQLLRQSVRKRCCRGLRSRKFNLIRDWFVIELGLSAGLRVQEMTQLKLADLYIENHHSSVLIRSGKGGKRRSVRISTDFKRICQLYLRIRRMFGGDLSPDACLLSLSHTPYVKRTLQHAFMRCIAEAKLSHHFHIHCLRHTYATYLLQSSRNLKLVKEQLGHASIKTTEVYISLLQEDTQIALDNLYKKGVHQ